MADIFSLPGQAGVSSKYVLRNSGEEVEVIAFNQVDNGARSEGDWVTYIDSDGKEHIKEPLNIQLDFKAAESLSSFYEKMMSMTSFKAPSTDNMRFYEVTKELVVKREMPVSSAVEIAKRIVDVAREEEQ